MTIMRIIAGRALRLSLFLAGFLTAAGAFARPSSTAAAADSVVPLSAGADPELFRRYRNAV
jgi:hypothetical protein